MEFIMNFEVGSHKSLKSPYLDMFTFGALKNAICNCLLENVFRATNVLPFATIR